MRHVSTVHFKLPFLDRSAEYNRYTAAIHANRLVFHHTKIGDIVLTIGLFVRIVHLSVGGMQLKYFDVFGETRIVLSRT